jgi:hypothetical protein
MSEDAPNVWVPEDLLEYYQQRADADPNIVDLQHAIRIVLRKHKMFEEGVLADPLEDLKLEAVTCPKCA